MLPLYVIGCTHAVFHFQVVNIFCVLCVNMFTFLSDVMAVCLITTNKKNLYRENDLLDIGLWCTKQGNKVQWDCTIKSPILLQIMKSIQRQSCQYAWGRGWTCKRREEPTA